MEAVNIIKEVKSGFEYLSEMVNVKDVHNTLTYSSSPLSNRALFIINKLNELDVKYKLVAFNNSFKEPLRELKYEDSKLLNIVVPIHTNSSSEEGGIIFLAHHDVNNTESQNCQDNSASVCNLLHLIGELKDKELNMNTYVVFTDREEFGGLGAQRLSEDIIAGDFGKIDHIINLELTGLGTEIWIDNKRNTHNKPKSGTYQMIEDVVGTDKLTAVDTPFSDAVVLRHHQLDAVCIGILPEEELGSKKTWHLCHSPNDTIDKIDGFNMYDFVQILVKFVMVGVE